MSKDNLCRGRGKLSFSACNNLTQSAIELINCAVCKSDATVTSPEWSGGRRLNVDIAESKYRQLRTTTLSQPSMPDVIRSKLNLSQSAFAGLLGVSLRTLQDWEQGRRRPQGPAVALLRIVEQHPETFPELR